MNALAVLGWVVLGLAALALAAFLVLLFLSMIDYERMSRVKCVCGHNNVKHRGPNSECIAAAGSYPNKAGVLVPFGRCACDEWRPTSKVPRVYRDQRRSLSGFDVIDTNDGTRP